MGLEFPSVDLKRFLEFLIASSNRFGCPENVCLGFFKPEKTEMLDKLDRVLVEVLRETDMIFPVKDGFFLILPETDRTGADFVSKGIFEFFNGEVAEVIVCFPQDGQDAQQLLKQLDSISRKKFGFILEKYFRS